MNAAEIVPHPFRFTSADGMEIACMRWESSGRPAGIVQIAHGLGEHMGRYIGTAESLVAAGLVVYGHDHRGHGRTALSQEPFGDFGPGGFDLLVEDVVRLSRIARCEQPGIPLILLGHSMGSFAAQKYVQDRSDLIDRLALSGPGILDGPERLAHSGNRTPAEVVNADFEPARTPADWLSRRSGGGGQVFERSVVFRMAAARCERVVFLSCAPSTRFSPPKQDPPRFADYVFSGSSIPAGGTRCSTKLTGMRSARICCGGFGAFSRQLRPLTALAVRQFADVAKEVAVMGEFGRHSFPLPPE